MDALDHCAFKRDDHGPLVGNRTRTRCSVRIPLEKWEQMYSLSLHGVHLYQKKGGCRSAELPYYRVYLNLVEYLRSLNQVFPSRHSDWLGYK